MTLIERLPHIHQWFSTGEMKPGQIRCIDCGRWGETYDAEKAEIERLTGASKSYEAQANKDCLEIERLTAEIELCRGVRGELADRVNSRTTELAKAKQYHAGELADVTAELAEMKADRDALSVAAALWNKRYIDACQQHNDRQTNLGHEIVALEAERDALKAALQLIKANTNTADWPDDINAAIQGAGK